MLLNQFRESARGFFGNDHTVNQPPAYRVPTGGDAPAMADPNFERVRKQMQDSVFNINNQIQRHIGAQEALNPKQGAVETIKGIGESIWDTITWPSRKVFGAIAGVYEDTNARIDKTLDTITYIAYAAIAVGGIVLFSSVRNALR